jgi:hypothetical protein
MKFKELLENIIDMGAENKLSQPPERSANTELITRKVQNIFNKAYLKEPLKNAKISEVKVIKADGGQVHLKIEYTNGKSSTSTFNTSHIMKYANNPKTLIELMTKTGYYA